MRPRGRRSPVLEVRFYLMHLFCFDFALPFDSKTLHRQIVYCAGSGPKIGVTTCCNLIQLSQAIQEFAWASVLTASVYFPSSP